jgi:hypothetical protein
VEKRYLVGARGCGQVSFRHHGGVTIVQQPDSTAPSGGDAETAAAPRRRRLDRGLLIASLVIACGGVLIVWGMTDALTGDDGVDRPEAIESVSPVENAVQVLQQEGVVVDFEYGYEGRLIIDGIELPITMLGQIDVQPGEMIELPPTAVFDPGNAILSFQPVEGALIESFSEGLHDALVIYWNTAEGEDTARSYRWTFNVI